MKEFQKALSLVSDDALFYHAKRSEYSKWLRSRALFPLANLFSNIEYEDFEDPNQIRDFLINSIKKGYKPYVLFLTQIQDINKFKIAKDIDSNYYKDYIEAKKAGVNFIDYRCYLSSKEIKIEKKINIINE